MNEACEKGHYRNTPPPIRWDLPLHWAGCGRVRVSFSGTFTFWPQAADPVPLGSVGRTRFEDLDAEDLAAADAVLAAWHDAAGTTHQDL